MNVLCRDRPRRFFRIFGQLVAWSTRWNQEERGKQHRAGELGAKQLKSETGRIRFRRARFQFSNTELGEFFLALTEFRGESSVRFLSAYYLCDKANSPSFFFAELTEFAPNSVRLSDFSLPKQCSRDSIPPVATRLGATGLRGSEREICLWEGLWEDLWEGGFQRFLEVLEVFRGFQFQRLWEVLQRFLETFRGFSKALSETLSECHFPLRVAGRVAPKSCCPLKLLQIFNSDVKKPLMQSTFSWRKGICIRCSFEERSAQKPRRERWPTVTNSNLRKGRQEIFIKRRGGGSKLAQSVWARGPPTLLPTRYWGAHS